VMAPATRAYRRPFAPRMFIQMHPEEKAAFEAAASSLFLTLSEWVRDACREKIARQKRGKS
jgi:hypothetical protein